MTGPRYAVTSLDELERLPVEGEGMLWRPLRRSLGIRAFGANAFTAGLAGQRVVEEHSEATNRHEELYAVLSGRATFALDGEELDAPAGTLVFVRPGTRRGALAAEDGTTVLALGGRAGEAFTPSVWEAFFASEAYRRLGAPERGRGVAEELAGNDPGAWQAWYSLARLDALEEKSESALEHLRRAVALDPAAARWAVRDDALAHIRDDPRFGSAVAGEP